MHMGASARPKITPATKQGQFRLIARLCATRVGNSYMSSSTYLNGISVSSTCNHNRRAHQKGGQGGGGGGR